MKKLKISFFVCVYGRGIEFIIVNNGSLTNKREKFVK